MAILSNKIIDLLQYRIAQEELSSRIYKAMAVWLGFNGFVGAEKLFNKYAEEEMVHAGWTYSYLADLNIMPVVPALTQPTGSFKGLPNIIALGMQHEIDVTNQCKELAIAARSENDELTYQLAQKFVHEQVEELGKFQALIDQLNAFGDDKIALRLLDNYIEEHLL